MMERVEEGEERWGEKVGRKEGGGITIIKSK